MTDDLEFVTQEALLLEAIAALVEPLTRFDRTSLTGITYAKETATAAARRRYEVTFRIAIAEAKGGLPGGVRDLGDGRSVRAHLAAAETRERRALPERLVAWRAHHASDAAAELDAGACSPPEPPVGWSWGCATCGATGSVTCGSCAGRKRVTCSDCGGSGHSRCFACSGSGQESCLPCGGAGSRQEQRTRQNWVVNAQNVSELHTEYYYEHVRCGGCGGSGRNRCAACSGTGTRSCHPCGSSGEISCPKCGATGRVRCVACDGTGRHHEIGRLACSVSAAFAVTPTSTIDEVRTTLARCADVAELARIAHVSASASASDAASLTRDFAAHVYVTVASLDAAGRSYRIVGYGTPPRVLDFKNLVGGLLLHDLEELEGAVRATWRIAPRPSPRLAPALGAVFASEANARIAANALALRPAAAEDVATGMAGAVSPEFAGRATNAIRGAISRIVWAGGAITVLALLALPAGIYALVYGVFALGTAHLVEPLAAVAALALAAVVVFEWRARRRVRAAVGTAHADAVIAGLKTSGGLARLRVTLGVAALLGVLGGWFAALVMVFGAPEPPR